MVLWQLLAYCTLFLIFLMTVPMRWEFTFSMTLWFLELIFGDFIEIGVIVSAAQISILLYVFVKEGVNWGTASDLTGIAILSCLSLVVTFNDELKDLGFWLLIGLAGVMFVFMPWIGWKEMKNNPGKYFWTAEAA